MLQCPKIHTERRSEKMYIIICASVFLSFLFDYHRVQQTMDCAPNPAHWCHKSQVFLESHPFVDVCPWLLLCYCGRVEQWPLSHLDPEQNTHQLALSESLLPSPLHCVSILTTGVSSALPSPALCRWGGHKVREAENTCYLGLLCLTYGRHGELTAVGLRKWCQLAGRHLCHWSCVGFSFRSRVSRCHLEEDQDEVLWKSF
jgi:hypothetical protein